jgi:hypothetical protein
MSTIWITHPRDETLSRLADQSQLERRCSRAGRHVSRCAPCTEKIHSMTALGDAARQIPDGAPPARVWRRVLSDASSPAREITGLPRDATPGFPDRQHRRPNASPRARRVAAALIAASVIVTVITLVWPSRSSHELRAASPERLVVSPEYPVRGSSVMVHYLPAHAKVVADTIWMSVLTVSPSSTPRDRYSADGDRTLPLRRDASGEYSGTLQLPNDAVAAVVDILRPSQLGLVANSSVRQLILTSDASGGRPSLLAMERASDLPLRASRAQLRTAFERWAADHPLRYLLADDGQPSTSVLEWVRRFTMRERTLVRLDKSLRARPTHGVFELVGIIDLAYLLEEPELARSWTDALVREHPDDPHALDAQVRALHQLELDGVPRDSIARELLSLDVLYEKAGGRTLQPWAISALVNNAGDSAAARRWRLREIRSGAFLGYRHSAFEEMRDRDVADSASAWAREYLQSAPVESSLEQRITKMRAYAALADAAYWRGDARRALSLTDTAQALGAPCLRYVGYARTAALLTLGDTLRAQDALAERSWWPDASRDSVRMLLGAKFDEPRWNASLGAAQARDRACRAGRSR